MHDILSYLAATYDPVAIIVYGSFADRTSNLFSDFDALLITADSVRLHDDSFIDCTQLDVFIHPLSDFAPGYDLGGICTGLRRTDPSGSQQSRRTSYKKR